MPLKDKYQAIDFSRLDAFVSDSRRARLAKQIDDMLAGNRAYVTIHEMLGLDPKQVLDSDDRIQDVRKILADMRRYLEAIGHTLEDDGKSKSKGKGYRYPLDYQYPFKEHRKVTKKLPIAEINEIAVQIANFIPSTFREDFLTGTDILASFHLNSDDGISYIAAEDNSLLIGVKHMKEILEAIKTKQKMWVQYTKTYQHEIQLELHPQYLKEYNGRWYVIGRTILLKDDNTEIEPRDRQNLALDRIIDLDFTGESDYLSNTTIDYREYFSDIIGVTHEKKWPHILHIELNIHSHYVYNLLRTKKLHPSQVEMDREGDFYVELDVRPNKELTAKLLSFGSSLEVVAPMEYRDYVASEIRKMMQYY